MIEPLSHYMKVGLIHFMAYPVSNGKGPVAETFRNICLDPFFEVAEITWIQDPEVRTQVKQMKETSHISVTFGAQPCLLSTKMNINDLSAENRMKAVQQLKRNIDEAYEIGATSLAFLSGPFEQETIEESYQALVASTKELCAYAASKGSLRIALEVFDYDVDKKSLIGPAALAARYAKEIREEYPAFGLMVDLSHIPLLHETVEESLSPVKEYIVH
ncbi:MAG: sugar phosphate isomerase/epimerase family protein, partial [Sphaerochaetaceae bacterium]